MTTPISAFSAPGLLLQLACLILVGATVARRPVILRAGIVLAATIALAVFASRLIVPAAWAALLLIVNGLHLWLLLASDRRIRFSDEEQRMLRQGLRGFGRGQARHLLDQGLWISGKSGETLTREGEAVTHLFYLDAGAARVLTGGKEVARFSAPGFVGEMTVLSGQGTTGTVILAEGARFWCASADALRRFLSEHPELRVILENSFARALSAKLTLSNRMIAAAGGINAAGGSPDS